MKIRGRIIRIIDNRTAIINLGRAHGIDHNSVFSVLSDVEIVVDPQTDEKLGELVVVKSKLKAATIEERFTVATTRWTVMAHVSDMSSFDGTEDLADFVEQVVDQGEMQITPDDVKPWRARKEEPVRVGDEVEVNVREKAVVSVAGKRTGLALATAE